MIKKYTPLLLALSIFISGCTTIPTSLATVEQTDKAKHHLKKNSMIFGRLAPESPAFTFSLFATNQDTKHIYTIMPAGQLFSKFKQDNRDGYFFSFVPPGDYKIKTMGFQDAGFIGDIKTDMSFTVPKDSAVYLGTITASWTTTKNYLIVQKGNVQYSVRDESRDAFSRLWKRFPELRDEGLNAIVGLIKIEGGHAVYTKNSDSYDNIDSSTPEKGDDFQYSPLNSKSINGN